MYKALLNKILVVIILLIYGCKKEPETDPIKIEGNIKYVSQYGGNDGAIDITISGGSLPYSFHWSTGETTEDITNLIAGDYYLTVSDSKNLRKSDTFQVLQPDPDSLSLNLIGQDVTFYGGSDGYASGVVSGGVEPYEYKWSNGSETISISNLVSDMYYLTVTDAIENIAIDSIYISQPDEFEIVIQYQISPPTESGAADGLISTTISGGYPPYEIEWSNGSHEEDIENLEAGKYIILVSDSRSQIKIDTIILSDSLMDIDGNTYAFVIIGDQTWMKSNLAVIHDSEGNEITSYAYNDNVNNVEKYGRLYTWDAAMNGSIEEDAQGICPDGWHIPSDEEYRDLEIYLGMTDDEANMVNDWRGEGVGTSLKKGGDSGYDAQLSGRRTSDGTYSLLGSFEYVWTSTEFEDNDNNAWRRCLDINSDEIGRWNTFPKTYAFSVRCVKDE